MIVVSVFYYFLFWNNTDRIELHKQVKCQITPDTVKPLNTADLGTDEKAAVFRKRWYWESYITYKTHIWDLKMGAVLGGRWYWEGGGIEGDDCRVNSVSHGPVSKEWRNLPRVRRD